MMRKRFLSLTCALALCLGLLPVTAEAAAGDAPSQLYVGNQQVSSGNDITYWTTDEGGNLTQSADNQSWNVKYDPTSATLTLSGATIKGGSDVASIPYGAGIYALSSSNQPVTLTIELIGENTITGTFGIYVNATPPTTPGTDASLVIKKSGDNGDNGSLTVTGTGNSGLHIISGTGDASLTIKNVSVVANATSSYSGSGVCVQSGASATGSPQLSLAVNGGSLTASGTGSSDGILFYVGSSQATGATTSLTVSENAIVDARNGGISALNISETLPTPTPTGNNSSGIVFDGSTGTVYGSVTLQDDLEIKSGETLTVPDGSSLNCNGNLTNNGTINVESGGTVTGKLKGSANDIQTPSITAQPTGQTVTEGTQAAFSVSATAGSETTTYQWQQSTDNGGSWTDISGATEASYTTGTTTTSMSGYQYRCVVKSASGVGVISQAATLTVNQSVSPTSYSISAYVAPAGAGTVTVNGSGTSATVTANSEVALAATANDGYRFTGWMENDRQVSTDATYTFKATGDRTLTAKFEKKVTGVTLNTETLELFTGGSATLTATVEPSDAANQNVTWASSDPSVATVDAAGKVTAVAPGTATITATTVDGGFTAICTVTVRPDIPPANPNYRITVEATQGGTVTADPTAAKAGTTVTLTPVPDRGYQVGSVAVTDRFGDPVAVTEQAGGTYTFTMPNGQVTVTVTFEQAPLPFPDVTEGDWFYDAVRCAYENSLMGGVGDNLFAPNSQTTRAQLVTILYRLAGEPEPGGDSGFADVETGTWYTDAVAWAAENGIVNGVSDTEFAPGDDITREQLAVILYRYAACQGYDVSQRADLSGFGDASSISGYAQEALSWAHAQGLVLGFEDGSLRPQGTASRAQIAAVLMRFLAAVPTE